MNFTNENTQKQLNKAFDLMAQAITTKTHKKTILENISRAFEFESRDGRLSYGYSTGFGEKHNDLSWTLLCNPYQFNEKRQAKCVEQHIHPEHLEILQYIRKIYMEAKELEVIAKPKKEKSEIEVKIEDFSTGRISQEDMTKYIEQKLPMSVNHNYVYCESRDGHHFAKSWYRIDWYLAGKRTSLSMIIAIAQKQEDSIREVA